jgi:hypothetical protein
MLIMAAITDVASDPRRVGAKPVPRSGGMWVYGLWHSRNRLARDRRVRHQWHKNLYREPAGGGVEISLTSGVPIHRAEPLGTHARNAKKLSGFVL